MKTAFEVFHSSVVGNISEQFVEYCAFGLVQSVQAVCVCVCVKRDWKELVSPMRCNIYGERKHATNTEGRMLSGT